MDSGCEQADRQQSDQGNMETTMECRLHRLADGKDQYPTPLNLDRAYRQTNSFPGKACGCLPENGSKKICSGNLRAAYLPIKIKVCRSTAKAPSLLATTLRGDCWVLRGQQQCVSRLPAEMTKTN